MTITKKDLARDEAKKKYAKEVEELANKTNQIINHHVSRQMKRFYNKVLRIAEKYSIAFEENYKVLKEGEIK